MNRIHVLEREDVLRYYGIDTKEKGFWSLAPSCRDNDILIFDWIYNTDFTSQRCTTFHQPTKEWQWRPSNARRIMHFAMIEQRPNKEFYLVLQEPVRYSVVFTNTPPSVRHIHSIWLAQLIRFTETGDFEAKLIEKASELMMAISKDKCR